MCLTLKWAMFWGNKSCILLVEPGCAKCSYPRLVVGVWSASFSFFLKLACWIGFNYPDAYRDVVSGFHVVRRSDRLWTALSTDLKQVLTRSLKTSEGLTRGRGITEQQRLIWLLSMPACAETNRLFQGITRVQYTGCQVPIFSLFLESFLFSPIFSRKPSIFPIFWFMMYKLRMKIFGQSVRRLMDSFNLSNTQSKFSRKKKRKLIRISWLMSVVCSICSSLPWREAISFLHWNIDLLMSFLLFMLIWRKLKLLWVLGNLKLSVGELN